MFEPKLVQLIDTNVEHMHYVNFKNKTHIHVKEYVIFICNAFK